MKKNLKIIITLKMFLLQAKKDRSAYVRKENDFSRDRVLTFEKVVLFIISLVKRSLSVELLDFFEHFGPALKCTKSAFSQQRKKLKYDFFKDWNQVLVNSFYNYETENIKRWKSHRLIGVDGSSAYLIDSDEIKKYFGTMGNDKKRIPMALIMNCYDVLNELSVKSAILPATTDERFIAEQWIETFSDDMIGIYDRGYATFAFMYLNIIGYEKEKKFVIRCPTETFLKEVRDFAKSGKFSQVVQISATFKSIQHLHQLGYMLNGKTSIKVRLVKVVLDTGEIEVLATNLFDSLKYPSDEFKELYFKRWPVETEYDKMKNKCQIEAFSGHSVEAIKQDFYAGIFIMNLHSLMMGQCEEELSRINTTRKYAYKINRNVTIGILKKRIVPIFINNSPMYILQKLKQEFLKELEPVRPGRKLPRVVKTQHVYRKFHTVTNYRRAV